MVFSILGRWQGKSLKQANIRSAYVFGQRVPRSRKQSGAKNTNPYSPLFFMSLIVTVLSSVAFLGILSVALGGG